MGSKAPQYRCDRCKDTGWVSFGPFFRGMYQCPACNGNPSSLYPKTPPSPPPPPKDEPESKALLPETKWFYERAMERSKEIKEGWKVQSKAKEPCPNCGAPMQSAHKEHGTFKELWQCWSFRYDSGAISQTDKCRITLLRRENERLRKENAAQKQEIVSLSDYIEELTNDYQRIVAKLPYGEMIFEDKYLNREQAERLSNGINRNGETA